MRGIPAKRLPEYVKAALRGRGNAVDVADGDFSSLRGMGIDLEAASGRDHHVIAIPAVFIIDSGGVIRWSHADVGYKVRPSVAQLLEAVDEVLP